VFLSDLTNVNVTQEGARREDISRADAKTLKSFGQGPTGRNGMIWGPDRETHSRHIPRESVGPRAENLSLRLHRKKFSICDRMLW